MAFQYLEKQKMTWQNHWMGRVVIADTTCLIAFDHIGKLQILKSLFGSLVVTDFVSLEYGRPLPGFIQIQNPVNKNVIRQHINS